MSYEKSIWKLASRVSGAVGLLTVVIAYVIYGINGFWGAVLGSSVAVIFFGIHLAVSTLTRDMDPIATMSLVMFSYFAKVLGLAGFLIAFRSATFLEQKAFALSAICVTAASQRHEARRPAMLL